VIAFSNTVDIARQPADVFAYLADLEHTPEWNRAITSTRKVSPGPIGVGTRYRQTRSVPRPAVETLEVTQLDPDRRIEVVGDLGPFRAHLTYDLSPTALGTRLTNAVELDPHGALGLLGNLLSGRIRASVAENLGVLRTLLEDGRARMGQ
jgi:uncharacterized protein YndB with AHSA1/START domain